MTEPFDFLLERADESDVPRCVAIANWAAAHTAANFATEPEPVEPWLEAFRATRESHPWLVARRDGEVLGFARALVHRARGAYRWTAEVSIYLDPAYHGRRVGTRLYGRLIPLLERQGFVTLLAGITSPHPPSERLHAAFGFVRCATYHRVGWKFGAWHDVGYWELHLQPEGVAPRPLLPVAEVFEEA